MGKLDQLRRSGGAAAAESMGAGLSIHGVSPVAAPVVDARLQNIKKAKNAADIPVDKILPDPDQPREEFDEEALHRLAESLRTKGQLQAIRVRWDEGRGAYVILCGERRWRAATLAGMPTIRADIHEGEVTPAELLAMQVIENALREDLKPVEAAKAFRSLMDLHSWSTRDVARELSIAQPQIVRALSLLNLPDSIQSKVDEGVLPAATAYEIQKVEDPAEQEQLARDVIAGGMTRDETAKVVRQASPRAKSAPSKKRSSQAPTLKPLKPRVLRVPSGGKLTLEPPKKATDRAVFLQMVEEAAAILRAEQGGASEAA